ncbi:hypothetical protein HELRODRAFT_147979, partial [Helobdella robusta]|uniref:Uncharacterized protein n=1 Tax=Helobdella robusta TaxID=6412 RepID=T1EK37_HELRO
IGIRGSSYTWFESYLKSRRQYVSIDGNKSENVIVKYSVPQGSVLGPLLFIIFV